MQLKKLKLFQFSWLTGWVALIGGWSIFLFWILGRYLWAKNFATLEEIGFYWIRIFFVMCLFALLSLSIYVYDHRKELKQLRKLYYIFLVLTLNACSSKKIMTDQLEYNVNISYLIHFENNKEWSSYSEYWLLEPSYGNKIEENLFRVETEFASDVVPLLNCCKDGYNHFGNFENLSDEDKLEYKKYKNIVDQTIDDDNRLIIEDSLGIEIRKNEMMIYVWKITSDYCKCNRTHSFTHSNVKGIIKDTIVCFSDTIETNSLSNNEKMFFNQYFKGKVGILR